jgi:hypothetical protein
LLCRKTTLVRSSPKARISSLVEDKDILRSFDIRPLQESVFFMPFK